MRRKMKFSKKLTIILLAIFIIVLVIYLFFRSNVDPVVRVMTETQIKSMTASAVNESVRLTMGDGVSYQELIDVRVDNDGKITMVQANVSLINQLARATEQRAAQILKTNEQLITTIPFGAFFNAPLLASLGPNIEVKMRSVSSVSAQFVSEFQEAGINQTRHKIILELTASVDLVLPLSATAILAKSQVLIAESILLGTVPEIYLKFSGLNDGSLDLLPNK